MEPKQAKKNVETEPLLNMILVMKKILCHFVTLNTLVYGWYAAFSHILLYDYQWPIYPCYVQCIMRAHAHPTHSHTFAEWSPV